MVKVGPKYQTQETRHTGNNSLMEQEANHGNLRTLHSFRTRQRIQRLVVGMSVEELRRIPYHMEDWGRDCVGDIICQFEHVPIKSGVTRCRGYQVLSRFVHFHSSILFAISFVCLLVRLTLTLNISWELVK